jgi:hypothetical protein
MCGFQKPEEYVKCVERRRKEAEKNISKEFKAKGIDNLFKLREDFMLELRDIFESYPVCRSLLTRVTSEISPKVMFERGLEEQVTTIGASVSRPELIVDLLQHFSDVLEGKLQIFIRDAVRSVWIYGFVVTTYVVTENNPDRGNTCSFPQVVDDDECIIFRDEAGNFYARGLRGEEYDLYFMDRPDVDGTVRSAMAHLYSNARYLEILRRCQIISARNAAPSVLVTSRRPDPEAEERKMQSDFEKREDKVTGYAVEALLRARPSTTLSNTDDNKRNNSRTTIPKSDLGFEREYVDASNNNEKLINELHRSRREVTQLRWLQQRELLKNVKGLDRSSRCSTGAALDDFVREQLVYKIDEGVEAYTVEGHRLDVKPIDIDSAKEEFNHHVKNVLLGTISFSERGSALDATSKRTGSLSSTNSIQRVIDACVSYWQQFFVNVVLKKWTTLTFIPLKPRLHKRKEDINALLPLLPFVAAERQAKILSEVLDVPEADILVPANAWTPYVKN